MLTTPQNQNKNILTLFRIDFFGDAHGWGDQKSPLSKSCHTYPTMMKLDIVIPYRKKILWHTPWVLLTSAFFTKNQHILLYQEIQIQIAFWYITSIYRNFLWVFIDRYNKTWLRFSWCQQNWPPQIFLKWRHFEREVIMSFILSITSPTKCFHMNQIILWMWPCDQSLATLAFV